MRTKVTLVLIFLNVALFFFIFKFERNWRTEAASQEARRRVLGPETAAIRTLTVTSTAPGGSFSLIRHRDSWFLAQPLDWPANPRAAGTIVNELQLLEHETAFNVADLAKNNLSLADYGLDKPKLTVAFSSGEPAAGTGPTPPPTELRIGDTTKDGKRLYVLSPDRQRVHIVKRSLVDCLTIPLDQLRADSLLTVRVFEARSLLLQTTGDAGVRVRIRRDGTRWNFETPIIARASKTAIELAINELNSLRAIAFPAATPTPAPAAAPTLRVTIEGNNRQETLFIGEPVPPPVPPAKPAAPTAPAAARPAPAAPVEYYAQLEGRSAVFTVTPPAPLLAVLRNAQEALREKRILEFEADGVTAIALSAPVQPKELPLTLQRLEAPAGQTANVAPPWQVVVRASETAGAQTLPADRAAVQRLLEQLSLVSARVFKSDAPTSADLEEWGFNRPLREITLTVAGNQPPVVLRIGTDANRRAYYARVGTNSDPGNSIYEISPEIERELPLSPVAWRDRAVTAPLPAAARLSSLRLTDLETKQVRLEITFNAAGEAAPPPRDPKALEQLVAGLRALRARSFLPGGFTDRIFAAGDERTWRLQLEATIALPATGGAEQTSTLSLLLTERLGGSQQFAGSKELDTVFALEQPLVDALWSLAYGDGPSGKTNAPDK
jgi:hypothetical protein